MQSPPSPHHTTPHHSHYPQRRACGDLLYVRLETLDGEAALHVTATPAGWFVNRSSDSAFDPAPAAAPHASRTLWTLLLRASPAFRRNYQAVSGGVYRWRGKDC